MPRLSRNKGIKVPIIPATMITAIKDMEMARAVGRFPFQAQVNTSRITASIIPLRVANSISLTSRLLTLPFKSSFANPWTMIALDCTPTLPAMAAISGVKKNRIACLLIISSKPPMMAAAPTPPIRPRNNQGNRARVSSQMLSSASTDCEIPAASW